MFEYISMLVSQTHWMKQVGFLKTRNSKFLSDCTCVIMSECNNSAHKWFMKADPLSHYQDIQKSIVNLFNDF